MEKRRLARWGVPRFAPNSVLRLVPWCAALGFVGCGSVFNPAFVSIIDPTGGSASINNSPGHVIVAFINNVTVDERLLAYLEGAGGVSLTEEQKRNLHPLIRATLNIRFTDGSVLELETVTGSEELVQAGFAGPSTFNVTVPPQLWTHVAICDVASVTLDPRDTEVFIPVEITSWQLIQTTNETGNVTGVTFEPRTRTPPQFQQLQLDDVDERQNLLTLRNVDIRDVPSPVNNPVCGAVIGVILEGTLSVPFLERDGVPISDAPSFDGDDDATIATIGGRYRFDVTIN